MSSIVRLAIILFLAALLAWFARSWFISHEKRSAPTPERVTVRAAGAELPTGLLLRESDLSWTSLPAEELPKGALREGSADSGLAGALLRGPKKPGSIILAGDVIRPDAPGFLAAALKPTMRAVSVPIDEVSGNAGLIQPGDFVDIILTQRLQQEPNHGRGARQVVSETVVERVRVIAVGSSFKRNTEENGPNRARTVTFEVSSRAAKAVTVAAQLGTLSMALRSFAIKDREQGGEPAASVVAWENDGDEGAGEQQRPVWGADISKALKGGEASQASPGGMREAPSRQIIILRGSQREERELGGNVR